MKTDKVNESIIKLLELIDRKTLSTEDARHIARIKNWLRDKESISKNSHGI